MRLLSLLSNSVLQFEHHVLAEIEQGHLRPIQVSNQCHFRSKREGQRPGSYDATCAREARLISHNDHGEQSQRDQSDPEDW